MHKLKEFIFEAGGWAVASNLASFIFFVLSIVSASKYGASLTAYVFLVISVPLFWIGAFAAWDKKAKELEKEKARHAKADIGGEVLYAKVTMAGESTENDGTTPNFDIAIKLRLAGKTNAETTLRDASLRVVKDGYTYQGERHKMDQSDIIRLFGRRQLVEKKERELFEAVSYDSPIRHRVASEGWLTFYVQGFDVSSNADKPVHADLTVTLTDELGGKHTITTKDVTIRPGY